ncbi:MAG: hypothetical protein IH991_04910 [Planctomycetes bacterium]|nr:hypothetical protein [Planctomycetota bacterium]
MYQSLRSKVSLTLFTALSSIALLVVSADAQAQMPRAFFKARRAKATNFKPTRPIKAVKNDAVVGNKKDLHRKPKLSLKSKPTQPVTTVKKDLVDGNRNPRLSNKWHLPTELAIIGKRVDAANLDYYISYAVTFENRGPYATLSNRTYQLVTLDANGTKNILYTGKVTTGLCPGATWEAGSIQTDINAKLLWYIVLDGKDKNGWNDFIILRDKR